MKVHLAYRNEDLGKAWQAHFANQTSVVIVAGDITSLECDAIVSPANSFGFMDGGLDLALSERFGWDLQETLQDKIRSLPERELLIGKALVLPTGDDKVAWLISAPTMRVPMSFNIASSVNAYLAMKAILISAIEHPSISSIAITGLCTGVGRMPAETSARQMFAAYREIALGEAPDFDDFGEAQKQQIELNPDGLIWDF